MRTNYLSFCFSYELPVVLLCACQEAREKELPILKEHHRVQSLVVETNTCSRVGQVGGPVSEILDIVSMRQTLGLSTLTVRPWPKSGRRRMTTSLPCPHASARPRRKPLPPCRSWQAQCPPWWQKERDQGAFELVVEVTQFSARHGNDGEQD